MPEYSFSQLAAMFTAQEEVVISGIGGWFPKTNNVEDFSHYLLQGKQLIEPKWNTGNFLFFSDDTNNRLSYNTVS